MKSISGKDFAKLLEKKDRVLQRINGSHHIYKHAESSDRISLPVHGNKALKIGLLKYLMKIAGVNEDEL